METKITIYSCIFLSLIVTSLGGFGNFRKRPKLVEIQPKNPRACSTENITLTCTRLNNDTSKSLIFQVHGNHVSDEEITVLDNKTISYQMSNLNATRDHSANVLCCLESCDGSAKMTKILQVYDKPKPVENFRCVVLNYRDSMTCDWDLVVPNPNPMRVILVWRIKSKYLGNLSWDSCPSHDDDDKSDNKTSCTWKSTRDGDFSTKTLIFKVRVNSDCGKSASSNYTIDTSDIVKPLPVDNLRATVLNSSCINVSWVPNSGAYVKRYEIYYNNVWDNGSLHVIQINDTEAHKWETKLEEICDLHPYTDYTFTVRAHPEGEGYWSDNTTITAKTYSDIPSESPRIIEGALIKNYKKCETAAVRKVTVYWQPLEEIDKNGEIEAIVFSTNESGTRPISLGSKVTDHTVDLGCTSAYHVTVQAKTINGISSPPSSIQIPVASYGVTCPEFHVEMANTTVGNSRDVYIECPSVSDDRVLGATVFWCKKLAGKCNSAVHWKEFPKSAGELVLPMTSPENYLYGISMETETGSSGLSKWESCIYTKNVAPLRSPSNVKVEPGSEDNTLSVTWMSLMCESGEPYIHTYKLQYCRVDKLDHCVTDITTVEVPAKETLYVLKDLEEDERFSIQMRGVTKVGMHGPLSDGVIGVPEINGFNPTWYNILGTVIGSIVGVIVLAAGAFCIFSYCYRRGKRKFKPPKIEPVLVNLVNETNTDSYTMTREDNAYTNFRQPMLTRQTSTDSGMGDEPVTPPVSDKKLEINRLDNIPEGYIAFVTEGVERTATTTEPTEAGVYSVNETGNAVHSYNDLDTNMVDARAEEDIVTRDGIRIVPQRQISLYNVKADSPIAVADVNLNSVNIANRTVDDYVKTTITPVPMSKPIAVADIGLNPVNIANKAVSDYVESTITPVPMTTPIAVADVGLNPVNIAKKAERDYVKSTITPVHTTTPVAESAGTGNVENVEEVNRAYEEETELEDQDMSSSGTFPDYFIGKPQEGNPTLGNVEREIKIEKDNNELDKTAAEISPLSRLISFPTEDNKDEGEGRQKLHTDKTENNNHPTANDLIESLSKPESNMSVKNKKSDFSQCQTQTNDLTSLKSMHASLKTNSAEVLPSETLSETPIFQQANQPTDCISSSLNQNNLIPKPVDIIRSPMVPLRESIFTTNQGNNMDDNTDQTNTPVISNSDNQVSALSSVSSKQNLKPAPTPYLSIDQLTAMASKVLPVTDQVSLHNLSQSTTKTNNQSYVTTDQLNAIQSSTGSPRTDTGFRTDNQMHASPVSVTESPNTSGETAQRPVQNTQPLNSIYKTVKQILTIQANFPHVNGVMNSNTDYQTNDQIPTPQCNN